MVDLSEIISDQSRLVEYVRNLLHHPASTNLEIDPLCYVLLLLDLLLLLRRLEVKENNNSKSESSGGELFGLGMEGTAVSDNGNEKQEETNREGIKKVENQFENHELNGIHEGCKLNGIINYIAEVYLYPISSSSTQGQNTRELTWTSPLSCGSKVPSLTKLCLCKNDSTTISQLARLACQEIINLLSSNSNPQLQELYTLSNSNASTSFFQEISENLRARRVIATNSVLQVTSSPITPSTLTFRWILRRILNNHFPDQFSSEPVMLDDNSVQGIRNSDDVGIESRWKHVIEIESDGEEKVEGADKVLEALASINRKDEKLTWIFGDNQHGPNSRRPKTAPTQSTYNANRHSMVLPTSPSSEFNPPSGESSSSCRRSSTVPLLSSPITVLRDQQPISTSFSSENSDSSIPTFGNLINRDPDNSTATYSNSALTTAQKSSGVKRVKKLNKLLGVPLEEGVARVLVTEKTRPNMGRRRSSFPLTSPTNIYYESTSPPLNDSIDSPFASPLSFEERELDDSVSPRTRDFFGSHHRNGIYSLKEERRRKIDKLQSLLGERVSTDQLCSQPTTSSSQISTSINPSTPGTSSPMNRDRSSSKGSRGSRIFDGMKKGVQEFSKHKKNGSSSGSNSGFNNDEELGVRSEQWIVVDQECLAKPHQNENGIEREGNKLHESRGELKEDSMLLDDLVRIRKIENVFGTLPPQSLYLSRSTSAKGRIRQSLPPPPLSPHQSPTSMNSDISLKYKNSIASLNYLLERDPEALGELTDSYADTNGIEREQEDVEGIKNFINRSSDPITYNQDPRFSSTSSAYALRSSVSTITSSTQLQRSSSTNSTIKVRQATKLANFFGSTRGVIWNNILNDLEKGIEEEEGIEEVEKSLLRGSLIGLRTGCKVLGESEEY